MGAGPFVRGDSPGDMEAVRDVCFDTGLMGEPVRDQFGENRGAVAFFESQGFVAAGAPTPNPGFRLVDGSRATVARFQRELA